jgi:hypothetical protein
MMQGPQPPGLLNGNRDDLAKETVLWSAPTGAVPKPERQRAATQMVRVGTSDLERFPFVLDREGFPKSCQCASLTALSRCGRDNAEALLDDLVNG